MSGPQTIDCRRFEEQLCDYLDDLLSLDARRLADEHRLSCEHCAELHAESEFALLALKQTAAIEPPAELIADIIHDTIGYAGTAPIVETAGGPSLGNPFVDFFRPLFSPFVQPRFVMSMAMTVLSFSMLTYQAQHVWQRWQAGEISVAETVEEMETRVEAVWERAVEVYDSAVLFYELQTGFGEAEPPGREPASAAREESLNGR